MSLGTKAMASLAAWMRGRGARADLRTEIDTTRWNVELVKRLEWRRFETLLAAYFEALEFSVRPPDKGGSERGVIALKLFTAENSTEPGLLVACQAWNVYSA